jgi:hydroxymethylglutaryl-CoA reductase (NADPH)
MASSSEKTSKALHTLNTFQHVDRLIESIKNKPAGTTESHRLPIELNTTSEGLKKRLEFLNLETGNQLPSLTGHLPFTDLHHL